MGTQLLIDISVGQYSTVALPFEDRRAILGILSPSKIPETWFLFTYSVTGGDLSSEGDPCLVTWKNKADTTYLQVLTYPKGRQEPVAMTMGLPLLRPWPMSQPVEPATPAS